METFKFIKDKYTNEKVVADSGVIKAVLSNGADVTNSVNDETFQNAAFTSGNVSNKEINVYTLRESLSNINPIGEVTDNNTVRITSLGVTKSPSGVDLPNAAADALSETSATATLLNGINWNISSGDLTSAVNVKVGKATVTKYAKFTISGNVSVKKFVKASGNLNNETVYTESNLASGGSTGNGYYNDGRKCVSIESYNTEAIVTITPSNLGNDTYHNLVVTAQNGWMLGINRNGSIGDSITDGTSLQDSFNINNADFGEITSTVRVSAWQASITNAGTEVKTEDDGDYIKAPGVKVGTTLKFRYNDTVEDASDTFTVDSENYIVGSSNVKAPAKDFSGRGYFYYKDSTISYTKRSEATVICDPNVYYQGYRLPIGSCFDINGNELKDGSALTNINTVYKEKCDVTSGGTPYKYETETIYYTYESKEVVNSSSDNCIISNNMLVANQTSFTKVGDENSIYLNERVDSVKKKVEFQ